MKQLGMEGFLLSNILSKEKRFLLSKFKNIQRSTSLDNGISNVTITEQ